MHITTPPARVNTDFTGSWCINRLSYEFVLVLASTTSYRQHNTLASYLSADPFVNGSLLGYLPYPIVEMRFTSYEYARLRPNSEDRLYEIREKVV